jgi:hypothetical protein
MTEEKIDGVNAIVCDICGNSEPAVFVLRFKIGKEIYDVCDPTNQSWMANPKDLCITKFLSKKEISECEFDGTVERIFLQEAEADD